MKMGFKGNTKKNSLKVENFSVIWETAPNLLITNKLLNKSMLTKSIDESYYEKVKGLVSEHFASGDTVHLILGMIISILVGVSFYYLEKPLSGRLVRLLK